MDSYYPIFFLLSNGLIKLDQEGDAWVFCPNYTFGVILFDHTDFSVTTISDPYEGMRLNNFLVKTVLPHSSVLVFYCMI